MRKLYYKARFKAYVFYQLKFKGLKQLHFTLADEVTEFPYEEAWKSLKALERGEYELCVGPTDEELAELIEKYPEERVNVLKDRFFLGGGFKAFDDYVPVNPAVRELFEK